MFGNILIALGVLAVGFVVSKFLYKKDTEVEERRRGAIAIAGSFRERGLDVLADFFIDYAVGDYSGMAKKLKNVGAVIGNPAAADDLFGTVMKKALSAKITDPTELAAILAKLGVK